MECLFTVTLLSASSSRGNRNRIPHNMHETHLAKAGSICQFPVIFNNYLCWWQIYYEQGFNVECRFWIIPKLFQFLNCFCHLLSERPPGTSSIGQRFLRRRPVVRRRRVPIPLIRTITRTTPMFIMLKKNWEATNFPPHLSATRAMFFLFSRFVLLFIFILLRSCFSLSLKWNYESPNNVDVFVIFPQFLSSAIEFHFHLFILIFNLTNHARLHEPRQEKKQNHHQKVKYVSKKLATRKWIPVIYIYIYIYHALFYYLQSNVVVNFKLLFVLLLLLLLLLLLFRFSAGSRTLPPSFKKNMVTQPNNGVPASQVIYTCHIIIINILIHCITMYILHLGFMSYRHSLA